MGIQSNQLIVVIESGPEEFSLLVEGLSATGTKNPIKHLGSGQAAKNYFFRLENSCEVAVERRPILILLDLHLVDIEGQELLTMLRRLPSFQRTPIIVFASSKNQAVANECYLLGANSCIHKPHTSRECVPMLTSLLTYWGHVIVASQATENVLPI